ncbi:MAG: hypothetical protein K0V04_31220 [Deltaproteobacteria bacterium]|nr:hypothetical protein [Deltaproteobacteria bacterium]
MACLDGKLRIRDTHRFRPLLFGIAYNRLELFYERNRKDAQAIDYSTHSAADLSPGPSTMMAEGAESLLLLTALRRTPIEHQVVLEMERLTAARRQSLGRAHDRSVSRGSASYLRPRLRPLPFWNFLACRTLRLARPVTRPSCAMRRGASPTSAISSPSVSCASCKIDAYRNGLSSSASRLSSCRTATC